METQLLLIITGIIVGWLTSILTKGSLAGIAGNIIVAISGAFFSHWLVGRFDLFAAEAGLFNTMVIAAIGAAMLLTLMRMLRLA